MVKKLLLAGVLTGSIGMNFYLLNSEVVVHNDLDSDLIEMDDEISLSQSAIQKPKITIKKNKKHIGKIRKDFLPEDKTQEIKADSSSADDKLDLKEVTYIETNYEVGVEKWKNLLTEKFEIEAGLDSEIVDKYLSVSKARKKAIDDFMTPKFENLQKGETLFISMEDNIEISKINETYIKKLRKEIGEENYNLYKKTRKDFNRKSLEPNSDRFYIEF
jgi:hypothetical protein